MARSAEFQTTAMREALGTDSLSSSSRFEINSMAWSVIPVIFSPGRARLAMGPVPTGSPAATMTMGTVEVARFAASAKGPGQ